MTTVRRASPARPAAPASAPWAERARPAARLPAGAELTLPAAPYLHLYVARGRVNYDEVGLVDGDAARITASTGATVAAHEDAELLVWEMHATLGD